ncbi:MAG: hypothetical protein HKO73_06400 [Woeseiaceae bacterium]|nr:hypothetical protein [Woeseiaceae bacterium]
MLQVAFLQIFIADAAFADELIVFVHPEEAQEVIERNEMQYEEIRWHSFPNHIRIAKIRVELLHEPGAEISITPFDDVTPVFVVSEGITESKWTGVKTRGGVPKDILKVELERQGASGIYDELVRQFNLVELRVGTVLRDRDTGEAIAYQGQYKLVPAGQEIGPILSNVPVFSEEQVKEQTYVYGTIKVLDPLAGAGTLRSFTIKRLDNDAEYVMIYEWDNSKNHYLMEPPHDPAAWAESELGQKYESLRKEKEAYLAQVAERIAKRNQSRGAQD